MSRLSRSLARTATFGDIYFRPTDRPQHRQGGQLELVDEDGNDESTYVDTDSYSHFRAFRLEASPGEYKKIEETHACLLVRPAPCRLHNFPSARCLQAC